MKDPVHTLSRSAFAHLATGYACRRDWAVLNHCSRN